MMHGWSIIHLWVPSFFLVVLTRRVKGKRRTLRNLLLLGANELPTNHIFASSAGGFFHSRSDPSNSHQLGYLTLLHPNQSLSIIRSQTRIHDSYSFFFPFQT